jgi:uncharacterized protein YdcH (DUF465 family)
MIDPNTFKNLAGMLNKIQEASKPLSEVMNNCENAIKDLKSSDKEAYKKARDIISKAKQAQKKDDIYSVLEAINNIDILRKDNSNEDLKKANDKLHDLQENDYNQYMQVIDHLKKGKYSIKDFVK